jgi:3-methyladenine DNA glycosylase AlkD
MPEHKIAPKYIADHIRRVLKDGGSAPHAEGVQRFFKEEIKSRGWYTAELRKLAVRFRRSILNQMGQDFLVQVADELFSGEVLDEKNIAVFLLQTLTPCFGDREFRLFATWLHRITSWADHDALVHYLLAPMIIMKPQRAEIVFRWAKSRDRWHRRAACVAFIQGARRKMFFEDITRLSDLLLGDQDAMVQKGLGWLLRETAKFDAQRTVPYLSKVRMQAPRLVLRTACETLARRAQEEILRN